VKPKDIFSIVRFVILYQFWYQAKVPTLSPTMVTKAELNSKVGELTSELDALHKDHEHCFKQQNSKFDELSGQIKLFIALEVQPIERTIN